MNKTVVVVGLSAASMSFVTKLRSVDSGIKIVCFSAEAQLPYNRCLLADVLTDETTQESIALKTVDYFAQNNIQYHLKSLVTKLDTQEQLVWVGDQKYHYDYLFLGIGTRPFIPSTLNTDGVAGIFSFHTLSDIENIKNYISQNNPTTAVVIGAGLNGIEAASSLAEKGLSVTLIEAQNSVLPGQVNLEIGSWVRSLICHRGVTVLTGKKVTKLSSVDSKITGVVLDSGATISTDMVVITAGSKLNNELIQNSSIALHNGSIVVSQNLQTNISNVLAAGDICAVPDFLSKKLVRSTTWSDAMLQGLCAATTLTNNPRAYQGALGLRDSYFFGKEFYACGDTISKEFLSVVKKFNHHEIEVLYVHERKLVGFVLIGNIDRVSELKKMYVTQADIIDE